MDPKQISITSIYDFNAEEELYSKIGSKSPFVYEQLSFKKKDLELPPTRSKERIELIMKQLGQSDLGEFLGGSSSKSEKEPANSSTKHQRN